MIYKLCDLKSSMDRFIAKDLTASRHSHFYLKSSMDRFIVSLSGEGVGVASIFKIQYG